MFEKSLMDLHKYLKTSKKDYLLLFDDVSLNDAINVVKLFTKEFIVLNNFCYIKSEFSQSLVKHIDTEKNLYKYMHKIFNKDIVEEDILEDTNLFNAVYFTISEAEDISQKEYEYFLLFDKLPGSFYVNDIIFNDNATVIVSYTNQKKPLAFRAQIDNKPVCIFLGCRIQQFFMTVPFLYELIKKQKKIMVILQSGSNVKNIFLDLFKDKIEIYEIKNYTVIEKIYKYFIYSAKFSRCYNALFNDSKVSGKFMHYYELLSNQFYDVDIKDPFMHVNEIKLQLLNTISTDDKKTVNKVTESKKIKIGLQFWTDEPGLGNMGIETCWNHEHVEELINSKDSIYEYYILNTYPSDQYSLTSNECIEVGHLPINALICLISELDYVVGINSFCCHIAAAFNVPTITLWNKQTPTLLPYEFIGLSFRALKNNFSIVPKSKDINDIKSTDVNSILSKCIDGKISLHKELFSLDYIFNNENVMFI